MDALISDVFLNGAGALLALAGSWLLKEVKKFFSTKIENEAIRAVGLEITDAAHKVVGHLETTTIKKVRKEGQKLSTEIAARAKAKAMAEVLDRVGDKRLETFRHYTGIGPATLKKIVDHEIELALDFVKGKI